MTTPQILAAAITSSNLNFQIPPIGIKLSKENYSLWKTTVIFALECFELESFILDPKPPSAVIHTEPVALSTAAATETPNPEFVTWKKKDRFVLLWLKSTLTEKCLASVACSTSAQQAWQTLERTF
ncbi:hypothetical protein LXL04_007155 [Taraxacum kok-saghyz]